VEQQPSGKLPRVVIGIPSANRFQSETVFCLLRLNHANLQVAHTVRVGAYVWVNRNKIIETAEELKADYCLMVDDDMSFPEDGLIRLLKLNKPVVGAVYKKRKLPLEPLAWAWRDDGLSVATELPKEPFRARRMGAGFLLINMAAVKDIPRPLFNTAYVLERFIGEDIYFCDKCNAHNVEVWADPTIQVGHVGPYVY
jgi:hypothetical protein